VRHRALLPVVLAQFLSSLADNALLIVAIGLLMKRHSPEWMAPALRLFFYLAYVLLAFMAGAVADAAPKGRVMWATNLVKLAGCFLLMLELPPLVAYALVGLGAAAYSPAKYGILPELLPASDLVAANAWIEASTVASILLGTALGGSLVNADAALPMIAGIYVLAAFAAWRIPHCPPRNREALKAPDRLLQAFARALILLWRDPQARITLAVTSLFWAAAAVLQFIVLRWAAERLALPLSQAALLQIAVAIGMVAGAIGAARWVTIERTMSVLPLGLVLGMLVMSMNWVDTVAIAVVVLALVGVLAGLILVAMNALLQRQGLRLMQPGQSIAVQNFYESLASLLMLAAYAALVAMQAPLEPTLTGFGVLLLVATTGLVAGSRRLLRAS
jgi:LPLT family lysophospholipid transporter-like MFS transporter